MTVFDLRRDQLLADYAAISKKKRRGGAAEATALRLRSRQYLDIMAAEASNATLEWPSLRHLLESPDELAAARLEPMVLAEIGRVLFLLQQLEEGDIQLGVEALRYGIDRLPKNMKSRRFRKLLVDYYVTSHRYASARELLDQWPDVDREFDGYLRAELSNPFFVNDGGDLELWLSQFNKTYRKHGLSEIKLEGDAAVPFDRLVSPARHPPSRRKTRWPKGRW